VTSARFVANIINMRVRVVILSRLDGFCFLAFSHKYTRVQNTKQPRGILYTPKYGRHAILYLYGVLTKDFIKDINGNRTFIIATNVRKMTFLWRLFTIKCIYIIIIIISNKKSFWSHKREREQFFSLRFGLLEFHMA